MQYSQAEDIKEKCASIASALDMGHIDLSRVSFMRSKGTSTRNTLARCHGLSKVMQLGMQTKAFYVIEVISEKFDKLDEEDKTKVLIHELMHIPKNFGGGFRHHNVVCHSEVERMFREYRKRIQAS